MICRFMNYQTVIPDLKMFKIADSICDGADSANSAAADDSDNFMYRSPDGETDCDGRYFEKKLNWTLLGQQYGIELTVMTKLTFNMKFVLLVCAYRRDVYLVLRHSYF